MENFDGPIDIDRALQVAVNAARGAGDIIKTTFRWYVISKCRFAADLQLAWLSVLSQWHQRYEKD